MGWPNNDLLWQVPMQLSQHSCRTEQVNPCRPRSFPVTNATTPVHLDRSESQSKIGVFSQWRSCFGSPQYSCALCPALLREAQTVSPAQPGVLVFTNIPVSILGRKTRTDRTHPVVCCRSGSGLERAGLRCAPVPAFPKGTKVHSKDWQHLLAMSVT